MRRLCFATLPFATLAILSTTSGRAAVPACDPDNGGIKLPQGFCAAVVVENVGRARHLVVAPNGDVFEVFADGFAGKTPLANPGDAVARPSGLAIGPDGSLCVTEDTKGRIWRVMYRGK